jgi:hypothetical protein
MQDQRRDRRLSGDDFSVAFGIDDGYPGQAMTNRIAMFDVFALAADAAEAVAVRAFAVIAATIKTVVLKTG